MTRLFAVALLALPLVPAAAEDPAPDAKPDKMICRLEPASGSILQKRTCHTRSEWQRIEAAENVRHVDDPRRAKDTITMGTTPR